MSMSVLKFIPADQEYVPSPEQQANAVAVFREIVRMVKSRQGSMRTWSSSTRANIAGMSCVHPAAIASKLIRLRAPISLRTGIVT